MLKWLLLPLVLTLLVVGTVALADDRPGCYPMEQVLEELTNKEQVSVFKGIAGQSGILALYVNPEDQSWVVVQLWKNGEACITGAGVGYGLMNPEDMTKPIPNAKES